jgi:hypothetical protein
MSVLVGSREKPRPEPSPPHREKQRTAPTAEKEELRRSKPRRHHLDRFADRIVENGDGDGKPDDLLTTRALAVWLGVSEEWLEIGRRAKEGYGPRFIKLARNIVRYRRSDVLDWLEKRRRMSVAGYSKPAKRTTRSLGVHQVAPPRPRDPPAMKS